jgi:hypothetical protein
MKRWMMDGWMEFLKIHWVPVPWVTTVVSSVSGVYYLTYLVTPSKALSSVLIIDYPS